MAGLSRRVGVLGGTFDPIHHGHLVAAQEVLHALELDCVLFVPAGSPPHKPAQPISAAHHRVAMVSLAIAARPRFQLSRVDVERPGPHFTFDALTILHERWGEDTRFFFIVGSDSLAELTTWHRPEGIITLADLAVVVRPGARVDLEALEAHLPGLGSHLHCVSMPLLQISSTDLRARVREGRPIAFLVPQPIEDYILEHGLYRAGET
jgi:nicotinate-nucleotide adenylyltransferase